VLADVPQEAAAIVEPIDQPGQPRLGRGIVQADLEGDACSCHASCSDVLPGLYFRGRGESECLTCKANRPGRRWHCRRPLSLPLPEQLFGAPGLQGANVGPLAGACRIGGLRHPPFSGQVEPDQQPLGRAVEIVPRGVV